MTRYLFSGLVLTFFFLFQASGAYAASDKKPVTETTATLATEMKKPKREMTEKQKQNVAIMRECGAEWRAAKAAGQVTKGQRWRAYLKECRAKKKSA